MDFLKQSLIRVLADYGMFVVLVVLCIFFSAVTFTEQSASGPAAADQLRSQMTSKLKSGARVMIAASTQANDPDFADSLESQLVDAGFLVESTVQGGPNEAKRALEQLQEKGVILDAIACSESSSSWLVFADLAADFPSLGAPRIYRPESYRFPNFLKRDNLLNIANQIAVIAIVAIGMTMIIITGGIDLSVGSLIALSAVVCSVLIRDAAGGKAASVASMVLCCLAAIMACGGIGAFSGLMITQFAIPPFIVTLAMMLVGSGLAYLLAQGQSIAEIPDSFVWLGRGANLLGIPNAVLLMLGLYAIAHVVMTRTKLGRHIYAVGGNSEAARLSGVPVSRVTMIAYITSGLLAGLGGVITASQLKSGSPTYGNMYELYMIAAVVVGGTSLRGGEGRMMGTLIGAFTIAVIQNGMNLTNVESYTQKVVLGLVILGAVLLDRLRQRPR
jgi:ribose transport system permease protein